MAFKATVIGREALMRKLDAIAPGAIAATAEVKLEVAREAARRIEAAAPVGATGAYKDSIIGARQADMPGSPAVGIASKDPDACGVYADFRWKFLEFGTKPHLIKGRNGKKLAFMAGDKLVSVDSVSHPGARAEPHVFPTWKAYKATAKRKISTALRKAVKQAMGK
ncbi:HK97 gp10 family phage protein [Mesorhizobium australicum]|uniref:HK97 gp10 family phage protein n=1 Tax=Mesorhizobium australicum TaxID=536018 RepID=A0ACC6T6C2_9HYPH